MDYMSLGGNLRLAIAIGFVFVGGVVLLAWRRSRKRRAEIHEHEPTKGGVADRVEIHAAGPISVENAAAGRVGEGEEKESGSGDVFNGPAPAAAANGLVESETGGSSPLASVEGALPISLPVEDFPEASREIAVSRVEVEMTPPLTAISEQESIPINPNNLIVPGDSNTGNSAGVGEMPQATEARARSEPGRENEPEAVPDLRVQMETVAPTEVVESIRAEEAAELPGTANVSDHSGVQQLVEDGDEVDDAARLPTRVEGTSARYRAPVLVPGKPRAGKPSKPRAIDREQVLDVRIRGISDRHGFCRFQLLGRRPAGAPDQVEAHSGRRAIVLSEVADEWYEILELPDLSAHMEHGITFSTSGDDNASRSWELRGRDLYVLAMLHGVPGFVSTARLCICDSDSGGRARGWREAGEARRGELGAGVGVC